MKTEHAENYIFLGSIILAAALVVLIFLPVLAAIVLGSTFAVLLQPFYSWLKKRLAHAGGEVAAALVVVLLAVVIIFVPLIFFGFQIFGEAQGLYTGITSGGSFATLHYLEAKLQGAVPSLNLDLNAYLQQFLGWIVNNIGTIFSGVAATFGTVFLAFFALYYFLKDGERVRAAVLEKSPFSRERTGQLLDRLHLVMSSIIRGSLLFAAIYGVFTGLGFFVFGVPSAVLWGAVAAIASFIPLLGIFLVVIPAVFFLVVSHHIAAAVGLTIWTVTVATFGENFLRPRIIGRRANIHPLLILFSVLGGLSFFGPLGLLLGPLALGLLLALLEIYPVLVER